MMTEVFKVQWSVDSKINALTTTRRGGASQGQYEGLNLADHVGDIPEDVVFNRSMITKNLKLPAEPKWLNQTHGTNVILADNLAIVPTVDGSYTTRNDCVCAVLTADCLPVFIADPSGCCVGVFHAGWRGLANGILYNAINCMRRYSKQLVAGFGPAISQQSFEVGTQVRDAFITENHSACDYFVSSQRANHYYADLYGLANLQLNRLGISVACLPEPVCTFKDKDRCFSYRRDGQCGRMASLIWINKG